jgi:acylphosphatase
MAKRLSIRGRVQGVGYRQWMVEEARSLGLTGWVRNRRDGSVEAVFSGDAGDVSEMLERCKDGPHSARVTAVTVTEEGASGPTGFDVLPTA